MTHSFCYSRREHIDTKTVEDDQIESTMQKELIQDNVTLNTQISCGQNTSVGQLDLSNCERTVPHTQLKSTSNTGLRYFVHRLKLCLLIPYVAFAIYTIVVISAGALVVYLTANQHQPNTCPISYKVLITQVENRDSTPQYVVMGDVNNDTNLDILVVTTGIDSIKILLSQGNGTFIDHLTLSTGRGSQPSSAAFDHFNHDRCLDIAVANYASHTVMIFIGDCHGQFHHHSIYSTGPSQPIIIKVGDLNNDGSLDLVVTNNGTDSVSVLLGHGDGTFADPVHYSTAFASFPHDIAVGDVNNDGAVDLIVANYGTDNVGIHFGYGNGSFAPQMTLWTGVGSRPYSLALADLNQDRHLDIVVASIGTGSVTLFLGNANRTFDQKSTPFLNVSGPVQLAINDLNNDDYQDIVIVSTENNYVYVMLGYDNGTFEQHSAYSTDLNSQPWSLALADVNHDNRTDVVVANYGTNNVGVLLGYDPGLFRNQTVYLIDEDSWPYSATLADVNNDTKLDVITVQGNTEHIGIFLGYGDGTFAPAMIYSTGHNSGPYSVTVGDFDEDTRLDIVVGNAKAGTIGIFLGYGNGSFQKQKTLSTGRASAPASVGVGDFNNDNHLDIVVANENTGNVGLFLGYGNGSFAMQRKFSTGESSRPSSIVVADFNHDQRLDVAVANNAARTVGIFLGDGTGNFTKQRVFSCRPYAPTFITVGDMNNDNHTDIIVAAVNDRPRTVGLFLGIGDGNFQMPMKYPAGVDSFPYGIGIGDVNNDNYRDIILANGNSGNVGILLGHGDGTFASQQIYDTGEDARSTSISLGDLNGDNRLDIVVTNDLGFTIGVLLGYNRGALASPKTYPTGSGAKPRSITFNDLNGDNQLDIVVANHGNNNIDVHMKSTDLTFINKISYQSGTDSLPNSVIVFDFNEDSNMDIAVANLGNDNIGLFYGHGNGTFDMGTFFSTGSGSQPCAIVAGDLNHDTYTDLVVSNYATSNIGVFLGYKYPNHRMERMYSTGFFSHPSHISIGDLNNDHQSDAVVLDSNTGSMLVFLGYGNGTFATPTVYRINPTYDPLTTVITDLNNDNQTDIIICLAPKDIGVYRGYGNGTMAKLKIYSTGEQSQLRDIRAADLNHDNCMDVVLVADSEMDHVIVLLGRCDGTFINQTSYFAGLNSWRLSISIADFNNDHHSDIVISNFERNNIGIFLGYGNGSFADQVTYSTGEDSAPMSIFVDDLNNDNHLDVVVVNGRSVNIGVFFGWGNGSFADQTIYSLPLTDELTYDAVAFGDLNNDTLLDITIASVYDSKVRLFLGHPDQTFKMAREYDVGYRAYPAWVVATDLNNDHALDMIVVDQIGGTMVVLLGSCCDLFLHQTTFSTGIDSGSYSVALGDFNSDRVLDVVVANLRSENIGVLLSHGNGSFYEQIIYPTGVGSRPYALVVGDCNNDTHLDIFVAHYGTETIGVLLGYGNGTFSEYVTYGTGLGSRPNAISALDFNNDNRLDIAITNDGTNNIAVLFGDGNGSFGGLTTYRTGYNTQPCAIAVGDYNNDNEMDIVITECGSNNIGVVSKFC